MKLGVVLEECQVVSSAMQLAAELPELEEGWEKKERRRNISDGVFALEGLLSGPECDALVKATEQLGYRTLEKEFPENERNNCRVLVLNKLWTDKLWESRLSNVFEDDDVLFIKPVGFGNEGCWRPIALNSCLKFGRYVANEKFAPHMDGPWTPVEDDASIYTVLIYLSTPGPGSGQTIFFDEVSKEQIAAVEAVKGNAVIFLHDTLHSGAPLLSQCSEPKYVLRTEVIFRRTNTSDMPLSVLERYKSLPNYKRMVTVYSQSQEAFRRGNVELFTAGYQEAIQIQRDASLRPRDAQRFGQGNLPLPRDVMIMILQRCSLRAVIAMSCVSKSVRLLTFDSRIWRPLFIRYFVDFVAETDAPPWFLKHCKKLRSPGTSNDARKLQIRNEIAQAALEDANELESVEPAYEENMSALQRFLLAKRREIHKAAVIDYFAKFRRETRIIRRTCPIAVVWCNEYWLTLGLQRGCNSKNQWDEWLQMWPATYGHKTWGSDHYRNVQFYFGKSQADCFDGLTLSPLWKDHAFTSHSAVRQVLQQFAKSYDLLILLDPRMPNWAGEEGFLRLDYRSLLCEHYVCNADSTLFISKPYSDGYLLEFGVQVRKIRNANLAEMHLLSYDTCSCVVLIGRETMGPVEDLVRQIFGRKVLNDWHESETDREQLPAKLALRNLRSLMKLV